MATHDLAKNDIAELRASSVPNFRFIVSDEDGTLGVFTECTLPVVEWEMEQVKEGGVNNYIHELPGRRKSARLTLKNGLGNLSLMDWFWDMSSGKFNRKMLTIELLRSMDKNDAVLTLTIHDAIPFKWTGPSLKASDNSIAIQSLEIACGSIEREEKSSESSG